MTEKTVCFCYLAFASDLQPIASIQTPSLSFELSDDYDYWEVPIFEKISALRARLHKGRRTDDR